MRIGIVELYCGKSGKIGYYNNQEVGLARAMKKRGYDSIIFYPQTDLNRPQKETLENNIQVVHVPAQAIGNHARYNWNILLKYDLDVIQIGSDNQLFTTDLIKFCDKHNIKVYHFIGTVKSDTDSKCKNAIMNLIMKRNIRALRTHKCFVKTRRVYEELKKYGITDLTIAPVGLDTEIIPQINASKLLLRKQLGIPKPKKILLFVGRTDPYKRPLDAIAVLSKLPLDYYLIMIGSGKLDAQIEEIIKKSNLANRITRLKQITNTEIHQYYKSADYYLNFNDKEIFGMSILEAMYQGCTVIAVRAPGPEEIIRDTINGFLVSSIDNMVDLLKSGRKISSELAQRSIQDGFTWDKTAEKFDRWIKQ